MFSRAQTSKYLSNYHVESTKWQSYDPYFWQGIRLLPSSSIYSPGGGIRQIYKCYVKYNKHLYRNRNKLIGEGRVLKWERCHIQVQVLHCDGDI